MGRKSQRNNHDYVSMGATSPFKSIDEKVLPSQFNIALMITNVTEFTQRTTLKQLIKMELLKSKDIITVQLY